MKKQAVDSLLLESLVSTTSLESLAKGYILNCKTEGKSPKTISGYEMALRNFIWYCRQNDFPEVQKLTAVHIRHFLWYLASEPIIKENKYLEEITAEAKSGLVLERSLELGHIWKAKLITEAVKSIDVPKYESDILRNL